LTLARALTAASSAGVQKQAMAYFFSHGSAITGSRWFSCPRSTRQRRPNRRESSHPGSKAIGGEVLFIRSLQWPPTPKPYPMVAAEYAQKRRDLAHQIGLGRKPKEELKKPARKPRSKKAAPAIGTDSDAGS
jgi:hypothetical protein